MLLLFTGSMLLFHPAASLVFQPWSLTVFFFFLLLSKRLRTQMDPAVLLVSLILGSVVLCVFVVFVLLLRLNELIAKG